MGSPVDVTDDGDWCGDLYDIGLSHEDFLCFFAYFAKEGLVEELFSEELFYARVEVKWSHFGDYARLGILRLHGCLCIFVHSFDIRSRQKD